MTYTSTPEHSVATSAEAFVGKIEVKHVDPPGSAAVTVARLQVVLSSEIDPPTIQEDVVQLLAAASTCHA